MEQEQILQAPQIAVANENEIVRADFIKKTYIHLALAVLLFIVVEFMFLSSPFFVNIGLKMAQGWTWLLVLGGFMFVTSYADNWARTATSKTQQYGALLLYVVAEAFIFIPLMVVASNFAGSGTNVIGQAGILTLGLFGGLTAFAFISGKDFSFLKGALTIGGIVAIGLIVCSLIFGFNLGTIFSAAMVLLAAGSILYQTSNIINHYNSQQYVAASLGLFASFMLLFWYILRIVMSFTSD